MPRPLMYAVIDQMRLMKAWRKVRESQPSDDRCLECGADPGQPCRTGCHCDDCSEVRK